MELLGLLTLYSPWTLIARATTLLITYVSIVLAVVQTPLSNLHVRGSYFLDIASFSIHCEATQVLSSQNCQVRMRASTLPQ